MLASRDARPHRDKTEGVLRGSPGSGRGERGHLRSGKRREEKKNAFVLCKYLLRAIMSAAKNTEGGAHPLSSILLETSLNH